MTYQPGPDRITVKLDAYAEADRVWALHDRSPADQAAHTPEEWYAKAYAASLRVALRYLPATEAREIADAAARGEEDAI